MPIHNIAFDTTTGKKYGYPQGGYVDFVEQVVSAPKSVFDITATYNFSDAQKLDAWVDGRDQIPTTHFTKNHTNNTVTFNTAVPVGSWVKIRVYL